ncbi:MAG: hypothetical protein QOI81_1695 [Actinomycetota bacterium]|nr:hypothetical protein [Actinomycetota bacterium]
MMDEFELTRRVLKDPPDDPEAEARALARLEKVMGAPQKAPSRRSPAWLAVAAAIAALSLGSLAVIQPFGHNNAAADELNNLGAIAGGAPGSVLGDGQYYLIQVQEFGTKRTTDLGSGSVFAMTVRDSMRTWIAADGTSYRETAYSSVRFSSPDDQATWQEAGRPTIPHAGDVDKDRFAKGNGPWMDTSGLSSDPVQLESQLRTRDGVTTDQGLYDTIGNLLSQGDASPALRAALFHVASGITGVELVGDVTDPLGRAGTAIALDESGHRTELIFDGSTSDLLALEKFNLSPDGSVELENSRAFEPTQIVTTLPNDATPAKN